MDRDKYKIMLIFFLLIIYNSGNSQQTEMAQDMNKYIIEKTLYWNQNVDVFEATEDEAFEILLQYEKNQLAKQGTLNFLADENLDKHLQLTEYLRDSMQIINEFKLNDAPFILADFQMPKNLSITDTENILKITERQVYKLHKVEKSDYGKYCIILSENYGFESLSYPKVFKTINEARKALTKILTIQIAHYRPKFVDIEESQSKTKEFIQFKSQFQYFYFYDGYLIFQPKKRDVRENRNDV